MGEQNAGPRDLATMGTKFLRPKLEAAGIRWCGWHGFRRGLATNLNRVGVDVRTIQAILGISSVSTALSFYVKTSSADSGAALERLEKQMGNGWATITQAIGS
jgi:integrase